MKKIPTGFLIACAYGVTSVSITFFNKAVLSVYEFKYSVTLTLAQMLFSLFFLLFLKQRGMIKLADFDWKVARLVAPLVISFNGMVLSGLAPLVYVNVPMYGALRRVATFMVIIAERYLLEKYTPGDEMMSVVLMIFGATIAGWGDLTFSSLGYSLVMLNCAVTALYLIFINKTSKEIELNTFGLLFYCNLLSLPVIIVLVIVTELTSVLQYPNLLDPGFLFCFIMSAAQAFLLNYFIFLCTTYNSPLTTSITGQLKNIFTTLLGLVLFNDVKLSTLLVSGLTLSTLASVWYAYIKVRQTYDLEAARQKDKEMGDIA